MSSMTSAGATPSARRSAVVETFACIATLIATIAASAVIQPPTMSDLKPTLTMMATLLRVDPAVTRRREMAEVGLAARTRKRGGTARTLAGSVRYDGNNYTGIRGFSYLAGFDVALGRGRLLTARGSEDAARPLLFTRRVSVNADSTTHRRSFLAGMV